MQLRETSWLSNPKVGFVKSTIHHSLRKENVGKTIELGPLYRELAVARQLYVKYVDEAMKAMRDKDVNAWRIADANAQAIDVLISQIGDDIEKLYESAQPGDIVLD